MGVSAHLSRVQRVVIVLEFKDDQHCLRVLRDVNPGVRAWFARCGTLVVSPNLSVGRRDANQDDVQMIEILHCVAWPRLKAELYFLSLAISNCFGNLLDSLAKLLRAIFRQGLQEFGQHIGVFGIRQCGDYRAAQIVLNGRRRTIITIAQVIPLGEGLKRIEPSRVRFHFKVRSSIESCETQRRVACLRLRPIFDDESWYARKLAKVVRDDCNTET